MKKIALILVLLLTANLLIAQKSVYQPDKNFTLVFYNVENLFDTINSADIRDGEFTPTGSNKWNSKRYWKKIEDISKVFASVNADELPEIIGLCEIENKIVLNDLIRSKYLNNGKYEVVHEESPDTRGIDVALLYRSEVFKYISHKAIPVSFPFDSNSKTRDILYVKGLVADADTFHIFVNHWSSRIGGEAQTEPKRVFAAMKLRHTVDSLFRVNPVAKIFIMGDFNDEPTNNSVFSFLMANNKQKNYAYNELYNLMYDLHNKQNEGSYFYRGNWNMLDQLIVSRSFFDENQGFYLGFDSGKIFRAEFMLEKANKNGIQTPFRTFAGSNYLGGVSDHLPVYVILKKK